ncbi:MAG TPA: hypothetical protein DCQ26_07275 [Marinilabiliales bacterium]|jgi:hypothetical protein|nr:MAG: hypothetical protein A2W95_14250 [Bacteroidetes bacterium GWA2_40_14]OFX71833.1 MAG: hypothetical protein A2W96_06280 [Bacteroidetes bacterium GWD2_40_43]OFX94631.1 MAG: hypothetical protein A2W97_18085 [Bacteroidetes bacterium GWE2_40_63]OFY21919.1 MAG: hypothetical protein A2W88_12295 [Bacteroidetes bacterium GWF2_40_13]OFZ24397.1 MAG: hypothetical protein A2437_18215 [Bacteroidetes bacterium RIFOXYC2_FULL_40_12]HAM98397.1 hypothetical protein [Marinilabiliales bacterium]
MKKLNYLLMMAFMASMTFVACDNEEETKTYDFFKDGVLSGNVTESITIPAGNYELDGAVHVKTGVTLTIEAGANFEANAGAISYLLIEQGAKINAVGTAASPVVFTSSVEEAGTWGGIMVCGYGIINSEGGTGVTEVGNAVYGGNNNSDNSGKLSYVRLEYTGVAFDDEHESNGFAFYSVGSATEVDHLATYMGADDGYEFFGGSVNAKYLASIGSEDDCFDWTEGWNGNIQYALAQQIGEVGDSGFECDNLEANHMASPYSSPTWSQVTVIGTYGDRGLRLRRGTQGEFYNIVIDGFKKRSVHVEDNTTLKGVNDGNLVVDYAYVTNEVSVAPFVYSKTADDLATADTAVVDANKFEVSSNVHVDALTVTAATTYTGGKDAATINSFFTSDSKIGSGNDWVGTWVRFE